LPYDLFYCSFDRTFRIHTTASRSQILFDQGLVRRASFRSSVFDTIFRRYAREGAAHCWTQLSMQPAGKGVWCPPRMGDREFKLGIAVQRRRLATFDGEAMR